MKDIKERWLTQEKYDSLKKVCPETIYHIIIEDYNDENKTHNMEIKTKWFHIKLREETADWYGYLLSMILIVFFIILFSFLTEIYT